MSKEHRSIGKIAVLGAGYMGSAITFPLSDNGIKVNLWGTWLDDDIIDACRKGKHPKLKKALHENITTYHSQNLKQAVEDVDCIFIGVSSDGFLPVFNKLLQCIEKDYIFFTLTKGLVSDGEGVRRISETAEKLFKERFPDKNFLWVSIGGPVKAIELSDFIPTASIYGMNDEAILEMIGSFSTDYYRILPFSDVIGVELSSAYKNIYAIAIGICDGIYKSSKEGLYHNFSSILFNQSVLEMSTIVERAGGRIGAVFNLAGFGDLYATALSGRNRMYGELVGKGMKPDDAYKMMTTEGETVEGYHTLGNGVKWINQLDGGLMTKVPLLKSLYSIIFQKQNPFDTLKGFVERFGI